MPYSGIEPGSELEKKIERCVEDVMEKHKGEEGFEKSNAIAICRDSIEKGDEQKAKGGIELKPVTNEEMADLPNLFYGSETDKTELMRFDQALLCTVGINANNDAIDESGIEELADTLRFMPIVDEHTNKVVGFVLESKARDKSTKLYGSGIFFAARFPSVVEDVRTGKKRISIEAVAKEAKCGECNAAFGSPREYCEHLKARTATRWLSGLKARGIATVEQPAWETSFDDNSFVMIASELNCECGDDEPKKAVVKEPTWVQELKAWVESKVVPLIGKNGMEKCYCEKCDKEFSHEKGKPCAETECPDCGEMMGPKVEAEENNTGGKKMAEFEILEGETLEEFSERLGLVAATDVTAKEEELKAEFEAEKAELQANFEAEKEELEAEAEKVRVGFERALELGEGKEEAEILAGLDEGAWEYVKRQREETQEEETTIQAEVEGEEEETSEAGQLQGNVLATTEEEDTLNVQNMGAFLSKNIRGGK